MLLGFVSWESQAGSGDTEWNLSRAVEGGAGKGYRKGVSVPGKQFRGGNVQGHRMGTVEDAPDALTASRGQ